MHQQRRQQLINKMQQRGLDYFVITSRDALFYLSGSQIDPGERLLMMILDQRGQATLYLHQMFRVELSDIDLQYYGDSDAPLERVKAQLRSAARIGVDKHLQARFLLPLISSLQAEFLIGSSLIDELRLIKDSREITLMRRASKINDQAMAKLQPLLARETWTERTLAQKIADIYVNLGAEGVSFTPIVCFGQSAAEPHHVNGDQALTQGSVIIDMGCIYQGYCSDMTRSFYRGNSSEKYRCAYQAVLAANQQAIAAVKPGVPLKHIDKIARQVIGDAGFADYFIHRTGHGIGIDLHEFPDVSSLSETVCQAGMIFSIEPGIYIAGEFGIRIEDLVLVTADGVEILNNYPKTLQYL